MKKILLLLVISITFGCVDKNSKQLEDQRDSLLVEIDNLRVEMDSLIQKNNRNAQEKNVEVDSVKQTLRERPELIPLEPVLGGTMRFGNIEFIDDDLMVADYNDGHIEGFSIYKYKMDEGAMEFELLYSFEY